MENPIQPNQAFDWLHSKYQVVKDMPHQTLLQFFLFSTFMGSCYVFFFGNGVSFFKNPDHLVGVIISSLIFFGYYKYTKTIQESAKAKAESLYEKKEQKAQTVDCGCGYVYNCYLNKDGVWISQVKCNKKIHMKEELN